MKECARKLNVDTQKVYMCPFQGKENSNIFLWCKNLFNLDSGKTSKSLSSECISSQLPVNVAKCLIVYFRSEVWVQLWFVEPQESQYVWPAAVHHHFHVLSTLAMLYNHCILWAQHLAGFTKLHSLVLLFLNSCQKHRTCLY